MEKQDRLFLFTFLMTTLLLIFFLRISITGKVIQTMHCDESGCYEFCKSNAECAIGICCQEQDFGICKVDCSQEYVFNPETNLQVYPYTEQPAEIQTTYTLFYLILFVITIIIGGLYLFFRGKKIHVLT